MKASKRVVSGDALAAELASSCEVVTLANGVLALRERASGEVMHPGAGPRVEAESIRLRAMRSGSARKRIANRLDESDSALSTTAVVLPW